MLMMEIPVWVTLAMAIAIILLASGILWNFTDHFRRSRWILRNSLTGEYWTTSHSFTLREIRRMMNQRHWNSELIRRAED
jgi:hypothetical protein